MTTRRGHPRTLRTARPTAAVILAALIAAAVACGGSSRPAAGVGGSKSGSTPIFNGTRIPTATIEAAPPTTTSPTSLPPTNTSALTGALTIAGARYAFTVRTCTALNGRYYLVGDGEASVALASPLVIQTPARGSFIVDQPAVAALTASGTARNLVLPGERVEVTLTATCAALAN